MQLIALPGFRDFFPEDLALRAHIFDAMRRVARRYAFEEYDGPPLEALDLYTDKSGDEIVGQLYSFTDRGGREVALRPEMTPTLARMVAQRANGLKKPIRWFSIPQLYRYERQQRGRLREHFQLNCDLIGEPGPLGDAEIIALAVDVMRALGLTSADVRVRLSDRRLLAVLLEEAGIGAGADRQGLAFQALDKLGRSEYGPRKRALLDAGVSGEAIAALESFPGIRTLADLEERFPAAAAAAQPLRVVTEALDAMELGDFADLDLTVVRGLAYYTGIVFELFDAQRALRAICGGGRYDDLLRRVGGVDLPALGFGMGDVVLGELLTERGLAPGAPANAEVFLVAATGDDRPAVLRLAHQLRDAGLRAEYSLADDKVGKQLKLADARRARLAVVLGPEERARNSAVLKDLRNGSQREVALAELASVLEAELRP
ncbi:MAG TPA: histidine--tRNA ligase [Gemmatimonadales bacterium]|jgi:histidyl-tRNA synthetase|nr:histidine--tRNA ligase [Gemmatimonadales bacterium]